MLWQSFTESKKVIIRRSQQAIGSVMKHQKDPNASNLQEASGSLKKAQRANNHKQTNTIQWL